MKIAAISDIHGNLGALDAVLADIAQRNVDVIVNLGDILSGSLQPGETVDRLMALNLPTIKGNHERQVLAGNPLQMGPSDQWAYASISPIQRSWLEQLPEQLQLSDDVLLVHGTPDSDLVYFLETVTESGCRPATKPEVTERAGNAKASLILCGHTHLPRMMQLDDGRLIVNPGSVGLQAYEDSDPFPHVIETGAPHARYAIVEKNLIGWSVEFIAVAYDWDAAAALAKKNRRQDWIAPLTSGFNAA